MSHVTSPSWDKFVFEKQSLFSAQNSGKRSGKKNFKYISEWSESESVFIGLPSSAIAGCLDNVNIIFNFSRQLKSLFIFNVLTRFSPEIQFSPLD